jgi:O-antigen ligase
MVSLLIVFSLILYSNTKKILLITIGLILGASILISNTRGLWLGTTFGLVFIALYGSLTFKKVVFYYVAIIGLVSSLFIANEFWESAIYRISTIFNFSTDQSNQIRGQQATELLNEFYNYPIIGKGFGASLNSGFYRIADIPYTFELSYFELLYKLGLLGFIIFAISIISIFFVIRSQKENKPMKIALTASFLAFLLLSGTNPYIVSSLGMFLLSVIYALSRETYHNNYESRPS